jgi:hypothetical protein
VRGKVNHSPLTRGELEGIKLFNALVDQTKKGKVEM